WRAARWGAGLLVGAQLVGLNAWAWKEKTALDRQEAAVRGLLTATFPTVRVVVDAPVQMERELAQLRQSTGAAGSGDLETLLAAAAAVLPPGRAATALDYSAGEARLRGLNLSADEAAQAATALQPQGIAARIDGDALALRPAGAP
ncbi:GspL/Epsl periplasmic domain-containing protein, partial [uncultured Xylophilus sp.]|uniref:GspL/Epsl periplasmic domain-containing protein n=1 Tax=uncultured Xylophilus sp. TaxID=296832 RepID=UPI0025CD1FEA